MMYSSPGMGCMTLIGLLLALCTAPAVAQVTAVVNSPPGSTSAECQTGAMFMHNHLRVNHQVSSLTWNETLASSAQALSTKLAAQNCAAAAFASDQNTYSLSAGSVYSSPCSTATLSWYAAGLNWTFSSNPIASNSALLNSATNIYAFAYVLWSNTTQLGCGAAQGPTGCWSVVCRYSSAVPAADSSPTVEAAYFNNVKAPAVRANLTDKDTCNSIALQGYNFHRREYQAPPMSWNTMLALGAQGWADTLARLGCQADASGAPVVEDREVWTGDPNSTLCAFLAEVAYRQGSLYKFTSTPWTDNAPQYGLVSAFIRMMDKTNIKFGCGRTKGPGGCWAGACWYGGQKTWDDISLLQDVALPAGVPSNAQTQCQQAALARANAYRAQHGALPLTWNSSLAAVAEGLAVSGAKTQCDTSWIGNKNGVDGFSTANTTVDAVCGQAVDSFYNSGNKTFQLTTTPWTDNQPGYNQWYTYTQLIWQDTTQVGCGSAQGPDGCWIVICKYDPPGNTQTDQAFIQNVLPLGSVLNVRGTATGLGDAGSSGTGKRNIAIIIGVCVAAGVVLAAVAGFLAWQWRKQLKGRMQKETRDKPGNIGSTSGFFVVADTTSSGPSDAVTTRQLSSQISDPTSMTPHVMEISGLMAGDLFARATAFAYSWNKSYSPAPGVAQAVEGGMNDMQLDAMVQSSNGQVQDCPVVCLSKEEIRQQLQLLSHGLRGRGGAALVFKALWPSRFGPDALLAVKVMKDGYDANPYVLESFMHEASVLASVRHPNVVRLYGYCLDPPNVCLIMELLPCSLKEVLYGRKDINADTSEFPTSGQNPTSRSSSLISQLSTRPVGKEGIPLTMSQVLQVSTEIAAGLAYLHDQPEQALRDAEGKVLSAVQEDSSAASGDVEQAVATSAKIVHRDLKPANILINSQGQVKISDFGLARRHDTTTIETRHVGAGTVPYQAPEILSGAQAGAYGIKATNRCDVYSMGMIFWELLSKRPPWRDLNELAILSQVIHGKRPELPGHDRAHRTSDTSLDLTNLPASLTALPAYNDIIRQCWAQRDWRRPTAAESHRLLVELQQKYEAPAAASVQLQNN